MLIFSAGTLITVLAVGFADMLAYRAVTGIGEAMQLTALLAIFSSYFSRYRASAVGGLNYAYAAGAIAGPALGTYLLQSFGTWRAPMVVFGLIGFVMMVVVAVVVRPWLSEANAAQHLVALNKSHFLSQVRRIKRGRVTARSRADDNNFSLY